MHLNQPINGMERTSNNTRLLARRLRRRHLHLRQRAVLRLDRRHAPQPAGARDGAHRVRAGATGCSRRDGGDLHVRRRASSTGRSARSTCRRRSSRCSARATGNGYWMLTQDGRVYAFGDAQAVRRHRRLHQLRRREPAPGVADRARATGSRPADGSVIAFGDARRLGFPVAIAGQPDRVDALTRSAGHNRSGPRASTSRKLVATEPNGSRKRQECRERGSGVAGRVGGRPLRPRLPDGHADLR